MGRSIDIQTAIKKEIVSMDRVEDKAPSEIVTEFMKPIPFNPPKYIEVPKNENTSVLERIDALIKYFNSGQKDPIPEPIITTESVEVFTTKAEQLGIDIISQGDVEAVLANSTLNTITKESETIIKG
jgi:hypothetical protein